MKEQQFTTDGPIRVEVRIAAGEFEISTIDGDETTVSLDGSAKLVDSARVELDGDRLIVEQQRKWFGLFGYRTDSLRVRTRVPHGSSVEIVTASGDAVLDGRFGGFEMSSASGEARVSGEIGGNVNVKTVSGDVRLPHVSGDLSARTVSGDVHAGSLDGSASVQSVSGDVHLGSLREGRVTLQSVSGDAELGIAPGTDIDVDAGSASGDLSSDVPLSETPGDGAQPTVVIRSNTVSGDFRVFRAA